MMERSLAAVLVKRERLRARIEDQRRDVARYTSGLASPIAVVDGIVAAGRFLRTHPLAALATVAALVILRGRALLRIAVRSLALWRLARRAQSLLRYIRP